MRLAPDFAEARLHRGVVLGRQGKLTAAVAEFQTALQLKPDLLDARLNLGIALITTDPAEALTQFEAVLQQNPSHAAALKYAQELRARNVLPESRRQF